MKKTYFVDDLAQIDTQTIIEPSGLVAIYPHSISIVNWYESLTNRNDHCHGTMARSERGNSLVFTPDQPKSPSEPRVKQTARYENIRLVEYEHTKKIEISFHDTNWRTVLYWLNTASKIAILRALVSQWAVGDDHLDPLGK